MTEPSEPEATEQAEAANPTEETTLRDAVEPESTAEPAGLEAPAASEVGDDSADDNDWEEPESGTSQSEEPSGDAAEVDAPAADRESASSEPPEPVTLPDEAHSRTSELAARLRQSALAQVEAARVRAAGELPPAADAGEDVDAAAASPQTSSPSAPSIPALDVAPEPMSEPIAVAAAAVAEAVATGSQQSFLSGPEEPAANPWGNRVRLATIVAGVLALAAVVVLVVFARASSHDHAIDKARSGALAAARTETATALSYSYQTLDSDFAKAEAGMSTAFRAKYAKTAASEVTPLAEKNQATSVGTVAAAGVISATTSRVSVLVYADQTNTNKLLGNKSRLDRSVIEVTMVKQGGHWVIDNLQPF